MTEPEELFRTYVKTTTKRFAVVTPGNLHDIALSLGASVNYHSGQPRLMTANREIEYGTLISPEGVCFSPAGWIESTPSPSLEPLELSGPIHGAITRAYRQVNTGCEWLAADDIRSILTVEVSRDAIAEAIRKSFDSIDNDELERSAFDIATEAVMVLYTEAQK